jgi:hypothetical protein
MPICKKVLSFFKFFSMRILENSSLSIDSTKYKLHATCQKYQLCVEMGQARAMLVRPKGWEISG